MKKYLYLPCVALLALAACDDAGNGDQQQSEVLPPPATESTMIDESGAEAVTDPQAVNPEVTSPMDGGETASPMPGTAGEMDAQGERVGNSGPSESMSAEGMPPAPNPESFNETAAEEGTKTDMSCGDHTAWIGHPVDEEAVKGLDQPYRIVKPGTPMTMDYREDRINVEHDDADIVTRVWCG